MIKRTTDITIVKKATDPWVEELNGFDAEEWISDPSNVALTNDNGDIALFERQYRLPSTVCGHYFFHSRGNEAKEAAVKMLKEAFTGPYDISVIMGLTPLDKKGALWMNKRLGFKSHGQIDTDIGPCEFVYLTKQDWEASQNE